MHISEAPCGKKSGARPSLDRGLCSAPCAVAIIGVVLTNDTPPATLWAARCALPRSALLKVFYVARGVAGRGRRGRGVCSTDRPSRPRSPQVPAGPRPAGPRRSPPTSAPSVSGDKLIASLHLADSRPAARRVYGNERLRGAASLIDIKHSASAHALYTHRTANGLYGPRGAVLPLGGGRFS